MQGKNHKIHKPFTQLSLGRGILDLYGKLSVHTEGKELSHDRNRIL